MGMLLEDPDKIAGMDMRTYYEIQLKNDQLILNQIDRAIIVLMKRVQTSEGVGEYTIDTGQDRQTVKPCDLPYLNQWKKSLLDEIARLSNALYGSDRWSQIIPGY